MTFLSKDVLDGLTTARKKSQKKKTRLRVVVGFESYPVIEFRSAGFALEKGNAPNLRGLVDLYRGGEHLYQCLIVASQEDGDLMRYEFKRQTVAATKAPLDYAQPSNAPVALIAHTAKT